MSSLWSSNCLLPRIPLIGSAVSSSHTETPIPTTHCRIRKLVPAMQSFPPSYWPIIQPLPYETTFLCSASFVCTLCGLCVLECASVFATTHFLYLYYTSCLYLANVLFWGGVIAFSLLESHLRSPTPVSLLDSHLRSPTPVSHLWVLLCCYYLPSLDCFAYGLLKNLSGNKNVIYFTC